MSQTIRDVVARFPCARLATPDQGAALSEFIRTQMISVRGFSLGFDRGSDFFSLLRAYGDQHWVFTFYNDDGSLVGLASLSRRFFRVKGSEEPIGYFGDLRLDPAAKKKVRVAWRELYEAVISHIEDPSSPEHCHAVYTAVFDGNIRGLNAFTRGLKGVIYHEWQSYVNLAVFHPLRLLPLQSGGATRCETRPQIHPAEDPGRLQSPGPAQSASANDSWLVAGSPAHPTIAAGRLVDLGESRTLVLRHPRWTQKVLISLLRILKWEWGRKRGALTFRMRAITQLEVSSGYGLSARTQAYAHLIRAAFSQPGERFDFVLLTLDDEKIHGALMKTFPIAYQIGGKLFEVTSPRRAPRLRAMRIQFEGAYL